jgi:hypothetical protein
MSNTKSLLNLFNYLKPNFPLFHNPLSRQISPSNNQGISITDNQGLYNIILSHHWQFKDHSLFLSKNEQVITFEPTINFTNDGYQPSFTIQLTDNDSIQVFID